ncbi:MAG TPA: hypothetical protein VGX94_10250 [Terriglobia bacterium]|nr:hypothetical protein [Terriglobia bacterium]
MTLTLLDDASKRPDLCHWNGPISSSVLDRWLEERRFAVPGDLRALWEQTGGGDLYETETILGPFGDPALGDDVNSVNEHYRAQGLSPEFLVFHTGLGGLTAVDQQNGGIAQIDPMTYQPYAFYPTLDEWYLKTIRTEYASSYDLP